MASNHGYNNELTSKTIYRKWKLCDNSNTLNKTCMAYWGKYSSHSPYVTRTDVATNCSVLCNFVRSKFRQGNLREKHGLTEIKSYSIMKISAISPTLLAK